MRKLSPETISRINRILEAKKEVQSRSTGASVSFHEKLAVLTAGSLALAISGAVALYQKPLSDLATTHRLLYFLSISVGCLWLSLIASVVHNFLDMYALGLDYKVAFQESTINLVQMMLETDEVKAAEGDFTTATDMVEVELKGKQGVYVKRSEAVRKCEMPISIISISLFALGYLFAVGYVFFLVR